MEEQYIKINRETFQKTFNPLFAMPMKKHKLKIKELARKHQNIHTLVHYFLPLKNY